jgi:hydrogenase maturation protease
VHFVRNPLPEIERRREMTKTVAVIGLGQSLRGDDAVGLEAVQQWRKKFPETAGRPEVRIEASELPGLALLDMLKDVNAAILVDAIQSSAAPGTIYRLNENELASFTSDSKSAHGWGVAETLRLGHPLMDTSPNIRIVGIAAEQMNMGAGLSKALKEAMPRICAVIEEEINQLLN